jgi:hypothetical protein
VEVWILVTRATRAEGVGSARYMCALEDLTAVSFAGEQDEGRTRCVGMGMGRAWEAVRAAWTRAWAWFPGRVMSAAKYYDGKQG